MLVNGGHSSWDPKNNDDRVGFIVGHESLHSAGYKHAVGPDNVQSYRYAPDGSPSQKLYNSITGTPAAIGDPDHLMSEVYP